MLWFNCCIVGNKCGSPVHHKSLLLIFIAQDPPCFCVESLQHHHVTEKTCDERN